MIKWNEFSEDGIRIEAFLPEHERESKHWFLVATRAERVVGVRATPLTWVPRMGPDVHDVAQAEAAADTLLAECRSVVGTPFAARSELIGPQFEDDDEPEPPPNPIMDAWKWRLIERFVAAIPRLGLAAADASRLLGLRSDLPVQGLLPFAVRKRRFELMRRLCNIASVLDAEPVRADTLRVRLHAVLAMDSGDALEALHTELVGQDRAGGAS